MSTKKEQHLESLGALQYHEWPNNRQCIISPPSLYFTSQISTDKSMSMIMTHMVYLSLITACKEVVMILMPYYSISKSKNLSKLLRFTVPTWHILTSNVIDSMMLAHKLLTHWGRVTHTCVSELTTIGSDNGLSPGRRQAIIWNNAGLLLIEPLRTNFNEISIGILTFSFKKMHLNMSSAKRRPFCLGLYVLMNCRASDNLNPSIRFEQWL